MPRKRSNPKIAEAALIESEIETTTPTSDPRAILEKIKDQPGIVGYIFRNTASAAIDLKDPSKIIDYAILSSSSLDMAEELSALFDLGTTKHIIVEGKDIKMLSLTIGENKLTVFMEKDVDHEKILKRL